MIIIINITKEKLFELYVKEEMSTRDIASEINCSQTTVRRKLSKFGIKTRSQEESRKTERYLDKARKNKPPVFEKQIERVTLTCPICQKEFERIKTQVGENNYCSVECTNIAKKGVSNEKLKKGKYVKCSNCGKEIYRPNCRINKTSNNFCSNKCHYEWRVKNKVYKGEKSPTWNGGEKELTCPVCGKKFKRVKSISEKNEINYCSRECMAKDYSHRFSGENSPTWNGGDINYYGPNWLAQRRLARERDNYTCQICGISEEELGKELSVHHIKFFRDCKSYKEANELDNLVCLCEEKCHRYVHSNSYKNELER